MRLGLYLGMTRRRIASAVPGPAEVPANVIAWADLREDGLEYVAGETGVTDGAPVHGTDGAAFDGVDDAISWGIAATAFSTMNGSGDFCLELFGLNVANEGGSVFGTDNGSGTRGFHLYYRLSPSRFEIICNTDAGLSTASIATPPVDTPMHFAIERSGANFTAYINGGSVATWTNAGVIVDPGRPFRLARRNTTDYKVMSLAAIRLTNHVRYGGAFTPPATPTYLRDPDAGNLVTYGAKLALGARTWFNSPSMIRDGDVVYFPIIGIGGTKARLMEWNTVSGVVATAHTSTTAGGDDHNEGAIIKLADGSWLFGSVGHNVDTFEMARGATPQTMTEANIAAQLAEIGMSYCNLAQLEGEENDPIYLFGRAGNPWSAKHSISLDGGATWTAYATWAEDANNRPYVQFWKSSDTRIDFILTEGHPDTLVTSVYHGYLEGGSFHKADGTVLSPLPINPASFTKVHDGATLGAAWVWDLKRIGGELVACYSANIAGNHRYFRAVLSGATWTAETIVSNAGPGLYVAQPNYAGGLCGHPTNKDIAFCSVSDGGAHQLWRFTRDGGGTWTGEQLTSGSQKCFRPDTCDGALTYVKGFYLSYQNFGDCNIWGASL